MFQDETGPDLGQGCRQPVNPLWYRLLLFPLLVFGCGSAFAGDLADLSHTPQNVHFLVDSLPDHDNQISLLDWKQKLRPVPTPPQKYNRRLQFGTWRSVRSDGSCLNARGLVLMRDSSTPVSVRASAVGCSVENGTWHDPYTGETFSHGHEVAVDHTVPLKNAYDNGGWRWSEGKRCLFFNFQKNPYHLIAIGSRENSSKGDSSPAQYMPPLRNAQCGYLKNWLKIKLAWDLALPEDEASAIREHFGQAGCDASEFTISTDELQAQRAEINSSSTACQFTQVGQNPQ